MSEMYDAVILGGGPAGSTAAWELARTGHNVIVLDREEFPRLKVCAGWITPPIFKLLELDPADYNGGTLQRFDSGSVVVGDTYYHTSFPKTASFGIIRQEFDHFLLKRAASVGAVVREGVKIKDFDRTANGVAVTLADGAVVEGKVLMGAGGTHCPVARKWGEKSKEETIIVAQESETKIGAEILKKLTPHFGTTELFPEDDFYGYAWYVTKGDWVNIGIGRFRHRTANLNKDRERFMDRIRKMGRIAGIEDKMVDFSGHSYKLYDEVPRKKAGDRFVLLGDAAGFATKWAGEGIKPAVQSALLASAVVARALKSGNADEAALSEYRRRCDEIFGVQENTLGTRMLSMIPEALKNTFAKKICTNDGLRRRFIFEYAFGFQPVDF